MADVALDCVVRIARDEGRVVDRQVVLALALLGLLLAVSRVAR